MYRIDRINSRLWLVTIDRNETGYTIVRSGQSEYAVQLFGQTVSTEPSQSLESALVLARWLHTRDTLATSLPGCTESSQSDSSTLA